MLYMFFAAFRISRNPTDIQMYGICPSVAYIRFRLDSHNRTHIVMMDTPNVMTTVILQLAEVQRLSLRVHLRTSAAAGFEFLNPHFNATLDWSEVLPDMSAYRKRLPHLEQDWND